jgi:hypothetical protein
MSIHIWCPRASESAINLRDAIRAAGVTCYKSPPEGSATRFINRTKENDVVVNWGDFDLPTVRCIKHFNNRAKTNKMDQLVELSLHGIPCPEVFDTPAADRLGRSFKHQCASDLLHGTGKDYYTQKLPFVREMRIHIFDGKSIHAGVKVPRTPEHHTWIRSSASGWKIDYSRSAQIRQERRDLAKRAVAALGLDFGAVDIGVVKNGTAAVIEVNTAPGLEGSTVEAYVKQILRVHNERNT